MTATTDPAGPRPLRVVRRRGHHESDVELVLHGSYTVVADVATALHLGGDDLLVDGRLQHGDASLPEAALGPGSLVEPAGGRQPPPPGPVGHRALPPEAAVARVGGLGAAEVLRFGVGRHEITHRGAVQFTVEVGATGTVSAAPVPGASLLVDGDPVDHAVTWTSQTIDAWGHAFRRVDLPVTPPPRGADHGGVTTFARAPRIRVPRSDQVVRQPALPDPLPAPAPFSWIGVLAPLPVGVAMALLLNPYFLLFTLLSPVMLVGRWGEGRWRARRHRSRAAAALAEAREELRHELASAGRAERVDAWRDHPPVAEWAERARRHASTLWERRTDHGDFLVLGLGAATRPWPPPTAPHEPRREFADLLSPLALPGMPLVADLGRGRAVGIVGARRRTLALARAALVGATAQSGPADLRVHLLVDERTAVDWDWCKWLPHLHGPTGRPMASTDPTDLTARLPVPPGGAVAGAAGPGTDRPLGPVDLLVVDGDGHLRGRGSPARRLLADGRAPARAIVVCDDAADLPAACTTVVDVDHGTVTDVLDGHGATDVLFAGVSVPAAATVARRLAGLEDSEAEATSSLPGHVSLLPLLGLGAEPSSAAIAAAWAAAGSDPRPAAVIGVDERGPLTVDLVTDGPHGLLAGTTGAGKSELLRTWVASLAGRVDPEHLNFVLVDFKGGGAFDACARLPHTVAVVTDLDDHLAARALRCLTAELRHREQVLRAAGVSDLSAHLALRPAEPLARLLVVVDEFATLVAELPDFVDSLVDIAQRGRSLGIHLLLATQRPAGVVDNKVKANTNLRIALRVQDDHDSLDVIGGAQAARLRRDQAGRGYARFGAGEVRAFQTALVTGRSRTNGGTAVDGPWPFTLLAEPSPPAHGDGTTPGEAGDDGPTDLDRLVDAIVTAARECGHRPPRVVWPDPLPGELDAAPLCGIDPQRRGATPIGMVDVPDEQCQRPLWFDAGEGSLLVYGVDSRDTTDSLATIALGLAHRHRPEELHLYVVDRAAGSLAPLARLPHCRYVAPDDDERVLRLLDRLEAEVARRRIGKQRRSERPAPLTVLLVDNYAGLIEAFDAAGRLDVAPRLAQVVRDGPALGIVAVASATNERGVPSRVANQVEQRLVHRLADPIGYAAFGLRSRDVPDLGPGRAIVAASGLECQIAHFAGRDLRAAVAELTCRSGRRGGTPTGPAPIDVLGHHVDLRSVGPMAATAGLLAIGLGLRHDDLSVAGLALAPGEHAVVAGPSRSGRSTALRTIAVAAARADPDLRVVAVTPRQPPTGAVTQLRLTGDDLPAWLATELGTGPTLLLVDDAGRLPAPAASALQTALEGAPDHLRVVAAGRVEELRRFGTWTAAVASGRTGLVLQPSPGDGDLLGVHLPLRPPGGGGGPLPPGRGYLVQGGVAALVQVAVAGPGSGPGAPPTRNMPP